MGSRIGPYNNLLRQISLYVDEDTKHGKFWFNQMHNDGYSFIHINKCGGTSIEALLGIPKVHDTAEQRIERIGLNQWNKRFTFSIVRNPYSKVVSHYNYRVKTNQTNMNTEPMDINEWIKRSYGDKEPQYYDNPLMFAPCYEWLSINGDLVVGKIIKLEELNAHWEQLCLDLGVAYTPPLVKNKTNMGSASGALEILNNESIKIIDNHFQKDFEHFGYK